MSDADTPGVRDRVLKVVKPLFASKQRGIEFLMLLLGLALTLLYFLFAGYGLDGRFHGELIPPVLVFTAAVFGAHIALRYLAPYADPLILPVAVLLNGIGLAVQWRNPTAVRNEDGQITGFEHVIGNQLIWSILGLALCVGVIFLIKEPRRLQSFPYLILIVGFIFVMLPLVPGLGHAELGARLWIRIGTYTFQPAEIGRICFVIFFAAYLVARRDALSLAGRRIGFIDLPRMRDTGPLVVAWALCILLFVGMTDLGTSLLIFTLFLAMVYAATRRISWVLIGLTMFSVAAVVAYFLFGHVRERVELLTRALDAEYMDQLVPCFSNPEEQCERGPNQIAQGVFQLADGGLFGTGLGNAQGFEGIPFINSDLVTIMIGTELGLTGFMALLLLYFLLVQRGLRTAVASTGMFVKLLATGISFLVAFQVFVVVGGVTLMIPLTGMTTPFLAAGGSSLIGTWILMGLLIRMSDSAYKPAPVAIQDEGMTQVITR
ncbi:FtsW/RodA/SpoVE family cell cycle protein [Allonocardiopsis opalescens]|uniref:Cell elongation-specific peptidoglycan biosynthesis regulator RodA n=1 Tax=Allonocardiopsis opalescens TaxID=1144618 RepID=A0A2T0Q6Z8_9ACTN|nr:FtsW/RodA/SpoVE family cell cycle protein [Allonocardiopsis opalescens]PRX99605.1 cell elongation-specific peptidoglycan biosynthesis regulator RodA [Allonocardiopsis opalescens]